MSMIVRPPEVLRQQVISMQKKASEKFAEKGLKNLMAAAGSIPPKGPSNLKNLELINKVAKTFDNSANKFNFSHLGKNLNKIV